ncbi:MAG: hypothetical protein KDA87_27445 [Planctomycetales bacterium]|nr:hypothetical protein [Planctomycetales bacterium]
MTAVSNTGWQPELPIRPMASQLCSLEQRRQRYVNLRTNVFITAERDRWDDVHHDGA